MCGCGAGMYELQLPQSLFDICHKFPADTNQWLLTATNDKDEQFCISVRKHEKEWINISIHDVDRRFFELLPDRWRCCIKTVSTTKRGYPDQVLCEVNDPDQGLCEVDDPDQGLCEVDDPDQGLCEVDDPDQGLCEVDDPDPEVNSDPDDALCEVNYSDGILHEENGPSETLFIVNDPDGTLRVVNDPDHALREVNDLDKTTYEVNDPDEALHAVKDPDQMSREINDPNSEVNDPDQMTHQVNDPDQMAHQVNDPDEALHGVKDPDQMSREINDPNSEVNDPDQMAHQVNDPDQMAHQVNDPDEELQVMKALDETLQEVTDPDDSLHDVKPDINNMETKCAVKTLRVEEKKTKLGRGCRRKKSTFHEMSCDYVMPSKGLSTGSGQRVDPGGVVDEETDPSNNVTTSDSPIQRRGRKRKTVTNAADISAESKTSLTNDETDCQPIDRDVQSRVKTDPLDNVTASDSPIQRRGRKRKTVTEAEVISPESNDEADCQPIDSVVAQVKTEAGEDGGCNGGEFDTEPCTGSTERVRRVKKKKPYTAYERVIRDKRTAMAALSKHEYHCALCPTYVCYTGKTLHNHIVFKHKMSSTAYQEFVAAHPMDSNGRYGVVDTWTGNDNSDDKDTTTQETVKVETSPKKKQCRRTLDSVEKTIGCLVCSQRFVQRTSMIKHVKQIHMTLENTEEMLRLLEQDKVAHAKQLSPIAVECPVCSAELRGKRIISHMKKIHANEPEFEQLFELAKNKYYSVRSKMALAREPPDRISCPYCGRQFARVSMRGHIRYRCRSNSERTRLYNCNLCGYCTPYEDHLRTHKAQHPDGVKCFVCHVCGRAYRTRAGLMVHTRIKHNIIKERPLLQFRCKVCAKTFPYSTQLTRHMSVHKDIRDCECDLCSRSFKDEVTLKRHRKTFHFNEYRFHCTKCGHGVEKRQYLERHVCGRVRQHKNRVIVSCGDYADGRFIENHDDNADGPVVDGRIIENYENATEGPVAIAPASEEQLSVFVDEKGTISGTASVGLSMDTASSGVMSSVNLGAITEWPGVEMVPNGQHQELLFVTADGVNDGPDVVYEEVVIPESAVIAMMGEVESTIGDGVNTVVVG